MRTRPRPHLSCARILGDHVLLELASKGKAELHAVLLLRSTRGVAHHATRRTPAGVGINHRKPGLPLETWTKMGRNAGERII